MKQPPPTPCCPHLSLRHFLKAIQTNAPHCDALPRLAAVRGPIQIAVESPTTPPIIKLDTPFYRGADANGKPYDGTMTVIQERNGLCRLDDRTGRVLPDELVGVEPVEGIAAHGLPRPRSEEHTS